MAIFESIIVGKDAVMRRLTTGAATVAQALVDEMRSQMTRAADWSRNNRLSGDPLHRRSGRLSRSVHGSAELDGAVVRGTLGSDVPYGRVHEIGGVFHIPTYTRRTRGKRGSGTVRAHDANFPQRAFLRPALESNRTQILNALRQRVVKVMQP